MKLSSLVGERFKEKPSDCVVDSHAFMVRGGYIKGVGNGITCPFDVEDERTARQVICSFPPGPRLTT